ncbi:MAG: hypothetical protein ACP6IP_00085, partial [Candidatus Njordarchaeia archaeon]
MPKTNRRKGNIVSSNINIKWEALKKELEQATENYLELKSTLEEMDLFIREVVNRTILLVQEMHEAISKLEEKASEIEASLTGRKPTQPTQPAQPTQPPPPQPAMQTQPTPRPQPTQPTQPPPPQP